MTSRLFVFLILCGACSSATNSGSPPPNDSQDASADAPIACPPAPLDEWTPPQYHPSDGAQPTACTAAMISDFYSSCLADTATQATCNQNWGTSEDAAHQTCQTCLVTDSLQPAWGPLVNFGTTVSLNVGGCIELLDPSQHGCAMSVQAADECEHQVCDMACPVADAASFTNYQQCVHAAVSGVCASYAQPAQCQNVEDAGPAAACVTGATFQDLFASVAKAFCGGT
jgi:hypothetical protein